MKRMSLLLILSIILFSCKKEVKPTSVNLNTIINSNEYIIKIDIVGGNIAGGYIDQMIIEVDNNHLNSTLNSKSLSKKINEVQKDSLKNILKRLVKLHNVEKTPLEFGSCTSSDENYTIENDNIIMQIKPQFGNEIYYEIIELLK